MHDNSFEVFDAYADVQLLFYFKFLKVQCVDGYRRL